MEMSIFKALNLKCLFRRNTKAAVNFTQILEVTRNNFLG